MKKIKVAPGIFWVEIPEADLRIVCGCPADTVKHLAKQGMIVSTTQGGFSFETGPNAILLSDTPVQKGSFANLSEFPLLQMFYKQGMLIPGHPSNTGRRPLLIGLGDQVRAQADYFFRGNYGLSSEEEIVASGVPAAAAREMFRVKKWFAFGTIRATSGARGNPRPGRGSGGACPGGGPAPQELQSVRVPFGGTVGRGGSHARSRGAVRALVQAAASRGQAGAFLRHSHRGRETAGTRRGPAWEASSVTGVCSTLWTPAPTSPFPWMPWALGRRTSKASSTLTRTTTISPVSLPWCVPNGE